MLAMMLISNIGAFGMDAIVMKFSSETSVKDDNEQRAFIMTGGTILVFFMSLLMMFFYLL